MKYFLHDTSSFDDEKITLLYMEYGYEGLGLFYTLLEKIGKQEKPVNTIVLKSQLNVGKRLEKCWKFMEEIDIIQSKNGETFNEQLLNFSENYQIKKEKTREKVAEWRDKQKDKKSVTGYVPVSNPPKVKESKVKKRKCLFRNSEIKIDDIETAFKKTEDLINADPKHYFNRLFDASESKGLMYTDWIATARSWARRDLNEDKLILRKQKKDLTKEW